MKTKTQTQDALNTSKLNRHETENSPSLSFRQCSSELKELIDAYWRSQKLKAIESVTMTEKVEKKIIDKLNSNIFPSPSNKLWLYIQSKFEKDFIKLRNTFSCSALQEIEFTERIEEILESMQASVLDSSWNVDRLLDYLIRMIELCHFVSARKYQTNRSYLDDSLTHLQKAFLIIHEKLKLFCQLNLDFDYLFPVISRSERIMSLPKYMQGLRTDIPNKRIFARDFKIGCLLHLILEVIQEFHSTDGCSESQNLMPFLADL